MTKFANKTFSVPLGSDAYRDGWERIFGNAPQNAPAPEIRAQAAASAHSGPSASLTRPGANAAVTHVAADTADAALRFDGADMMPLENEGGD